MISDANEGSLSQRRSYEHRKSSNQEWLFLLITIALFAVAAATNLYSAARCTWIHRSQLHYFFAGLLSDYSVFSRQDVRAVCKYIGTVKGVCAGVTTPRLFLKAWVTSASRRRYSSKHTPPSTRARTLNGDVAGQRPVCSRSPRLFSDTANSALTSTHYTTATLLYAGREPRSGTSIYGGRSSPTPVTLRSAEGCRGAPVRAEPQLALQIDDRLTVLRSEIAQAMPPAGEAIIAARKKIGCRSMVDSLISGSGVVSEDRKGRHGFA